MLIEAVNSFPELLAGAAIPTAVLAAGRAYWKSATRSIRERTAWSVNTILESVPTGDEVDRQPEAHD
jgi:hypothetical protein